MNIVVFRLGLISCVPMCTHNVFAIPKSTSEVLCTILDCSKALGKAVNNYVDEVSSTFSYQGVDDLASHGTI